jgi:Uma2 family endonuclease
MMAEISKIEGEILAENVDFETFLRDYMDQHVELVNGMVIKMSPVTSKHDNITGFLRTLFDLFLERTNMGVVKADPFLARIPGGHPRQPDLMIITTPNLDKIKPTYLDGAPDLIVEVVSPGSIELDRGTKFEEYEKGGVKEYWLLDPVHQENLFYVLDENGVYKSQSLDSEGYYSSTVLSGFRFQPAILLQPTIPRASTAVALVEKMLAK